MNQTQLDGITKARLATNIAQANAGQLLFANDAAYLAHVCASAGFETLPDYAADSYAEQFAGKTIKDLEVELAAAIDAARDKPNAPDLPTPVVDGVPTRVTMRQARLAMFGAGLLPLVETAISSLPEPDKTAATIEWEYSGEVHRDQTLVQVLGGALGLTSEQLDGLFIAADKL